MNAPLLVDDSGRPVAIDRQLASGGEGTVYTISGDPNRVAKVYHRLPSLQTVEKLTVMSKLATPRLLTLAAWPSELLRDAKTKQAAGFMMPRLIDCQPIQHLYNPVQRLKFFPQAGWTFQVRTAQNLAAVFDEIHKAGCLVGDVNQSNAQVTHQALVRLIDCDSFQVRANGKQFLCDVGVPHYTSPELQGKSLRGLVRSENHDRFGLAVLIYQLLFVGRHPYAGVYHGAGDPPFDQLISEFRFAQGPSASSWGMAPPPHTPTFDDIPPDVGTLFRRAFERGSETGNRPKPNQWLSALIGLEHEIVECPADAGHKFWRGCKECVWCRLAAKGGPEYYYGVAAGGATYAVDEAKLREVLRRLEKVNQIEFPYRREKFLPSPPCPKPIPHEISRLVVEREALEIKHRNTIRSEQIRDTRETEHQANEIEQLRQKLLRQLNQRESEFDLELQNIIRIDELQTKLHQQLEQQNKAFDEEFEATRGIQQEKAEKLRQLFEQQEMTFDAELQKIGELEQTQEEISRRQIEQQEKTFDAELQKIRKLEQERTENSRRQFELQDIAFDEEIRESSEKALIHEKNLHEQLETQEKIINGQIREQLDSVAAEVRDQRYVSRVLALLCVLGFCISPLSFYHWIFAVLGGLLVLVFGISLSVQSYRSGNSRSSLEVRSLRKQLKQRRSDVERRLNEARRDSKQLRVRITNSKKQMKMDLDKDLETTRHVAEQERSRALIAKKQARIHVERTLDEARRHLEQERSRVLTAKKQARIHVRRTLDEARQHLEQERSRILTAKKQARIAAEKTFVKAKQSAEQERSRILNAKNQAQLIVEKTLDEARQRAEQDRRLGMAEAQKTLHQFERQIAEIAQEIRRRTEEEANARRRLMRQYEVEVAAHESLWIKHVEVFRVQRQQRVAQISSLVTNTRALATQYQTEVQLLTANAEVAARIRHMRLHLLADADIPKVGAGRKQTLASYKIFTAADINKNAIRGIKGFGDSLTANLVAWQMEVLRQFRFDPAKDISPGDQLSTTMKFRTLQKKHFAEVDQHLSNLDSLVAACQMALDKLIPVLKKALAAWEQAQADVRIMNGKV